jgi:hypothetical protein
MRTESFASHETLQGGNRKRWTCRTSLKNTVGKSDNCFDEHEQCGTQIWTHATLRSSEDKELNVGCVQSKEELKHDWVFFLTNTFISQHDCYSILNTQQKNMKKQSKP